MKTNSLSVLCLSLLLFHIDCSFAKRGGGFGKSFGFKKSPTSNRGNTHTNTNTGHKSSQGSSSHSGYPKQSGQGNQGGYPPQSGRPGYPGGYPRQQGGGGYHNQYPAQGSPYGGYGSHGGYGRYGGNGGYGGYGGHGGYPGGYINQNPNNKILSPHYGGSFGYGGYGVGGGSPFSHSVQAMGMYPSDKSRGFGRSAVMAAAGGAMAGMALGYGLGRFPRPHFNFHSPQEEYYYNNYMYRRYGVKSTDTNDYGRDYGYTKPPDTYDSYMDSCMKRRDILPVENRKPNENPVAADKPTGVTSALDAGSNTTETNSSAASTPQPVNQAEGNNLPPASQAVSDAEDDDTVSIVEIGYPALIEQLKARRCLELYMVYSEKYLTREAGGAQGLEMSLQGLLAVVTSTLLMLLNSNLLMLIH
ncbi:RNA-binding protein FUS [Anabas testudineus]|uniref:Prion protein, related sequence 3 n=1 Tax=Anabas testudineus TaxID=64144 RepID=A0A3Q1K8A9_ANATE|nr:RNA-binding protein FUS [Anabas testudineus]XP_026200132.1 RNA-binding protein FUS [Anabas testudineus]